MTRIIAGRARSLALAVPGSGTRPTSDRVRESLFGALEAAGLVRDAAVLDLYAGSGALGLEAVSRGAASAELVEKAPVAASVAERNARNVARAVPGARVHVRRTGADAFLRREPGPYDLVFLDPPYDLGDSELAATLEVLVPALAADAVVVIERAARSPQPILPDGLALTRSKRYGDTMLWWVARA
ncbi:16S rRNA (guanine(966)-N(2))-methyltransferase RsmD [Microbacterium sp.]|uniref:16S rRNA (guanine(966)-N(2))-methyltransferase RsmD n=1 Tax=Microbacterium sp. TaxID=51671 RepID=UPI0039E330A5